MLNRKCSNPYYTTIDNLSINKDVFKSNRVTPRVSCELEKFAKYIPDRTIAIGPNRYIGLYKNM